MPVPEEDTVMTKFALYVPLQAKPGKEKEVADFLRSAAPVVNDESGTVSWFAIQEGPSFFAIFDTFDDEAGRDASQRQGSGGPNGEGQSWRFICQNARNPLTLNFGRQTPKIRPPVLWRVGS